MSVESERDFSSSSSCYKIEGCSATTKWLMNCRVCDVFLYPRGFIFAARIYYLCNFEFLKRAKMCI